LAFFDERIEKGLVAKLEGIVGSEFVHMDYGEAIQVLERANKKFEFPVQWGIDLQSEHEHYLTEKYAKKPVIVMNYPKAIKAFYMRVNDDGRTVRRWTFWRRGSARSLRQPARGAARGAGPQYGRARHRPGALPPPFPLPRAGVRKAVSCTAKARCRTPDSVSVLSAPSPSHRLRQRARRDPLPANARKR